MQALRAAGYGIEYILPTSMQNGMNLKPTRISEGVHLLAQALRAAGYGIEYILPIGNCAGLDIAQSNWKVAAYWQVCFYSFRHGYAHRM